MKLSIIIISLVGLFGRSSLVFAAPNRPKKAPAPRALPFVVPRGGAGPLDPSTVAKASATGLLAIHALSILGPEKALQGYGIKDPIPVNVFVAQREWTFFLAASLGAYLSIVHDKSTNFAIGYGTFPIIAEVLRSILNDEQEKLGISNVAQLIVVLLPALFCAYSCLNNMENANTVTMVCGCYNIVKGIWYFVDTENSGKTWGLKGEADLFTLESAKWMGISLIVYGMTLIGMVKGMDTNKLMGYAWIPVVINLARQTFVTNYVDKYDLNKSLYYVWMILGAIVIGTLAID